MEKEHILLLIFSFFVLNPIAGAHDDSSPASCGPNEPEIRFPFRILNRQPAKCGFPGFDLSCNKQNKTIIQLPSSLPYIVNKISYLSQVIYIDPEFCQPNRIVSVNKTGTPFTYSILRSYAFYNCSPQNYSSIYPYLTYPCLSSQNNSVIAALTDSYSFYAGYVPTNCKTMKTIMVPVGSDRDVSQGLELMWSYPYCRSCEEEGKSCRLKGDNGDTVSVSSSRGKGISRSAKYGLIIGIGVPGLICIIGLVCYTSSRVQDHNDSHNQSIEVSSVPIVPQPASRRGLDGPTIESYPKTVLGDSCSLPNDDGICAICLCDYKPKESLRTIPECNHYFHAECIDEWLKLNVTCPVCRNTPESSALVTPCSSTASSTSSVD